jgi:hypothetical protein
VDSETLSSVPELTQHGDGSYQPQAVSAPSRRFLSTLAGAWWSLLCLSGPGSSLVGFLCAVTCWVALWLTAFRTW